MKSEKKANPPQSVKATEEDFFVEERRQLIVECLNVDLRTTVTQLSKKFSVSPATIRSDLRELESLGLLKRTHGGAVSNIKTNYELNSYQKEVKHVEEKKKIAQAAAKYIHENDTVALDTGTTAFELAKLLVSFKNLTVVTNDLQIASFLECHSSTNIIFVGGWVRRNFHCTTGQIAVDTISGLNVDKSFIAANGFDLRKGLSTPNPETAYFKKKLIEIASQVIVIADSSKCNKVSFVKFADISDIDIIVTDNKMPNDVVKALEKENINVDIVK